jgi:membrane associated rhomboid family serine protease
MTTGGHDDYRLLVEVDRPADVARVRRALDLARVPFRSGLLAGAPPRVLFYVPEARLDESRAALGRAPTDREAVEPDPGAAAPARFPWGAVQVVAAVVLLHLGLVFWILGPWPPGVELFRSAGLDPARVLAEPWRLVTSLFLHADPAHALWNGLAMLIFGVPLLTRVGFARTATIYLLAGLGGGATAAAFARRTAVIIGSSGAVAGLFGAWVVLTWAHARRSSPSWRSTVRVLGVGLLFLPSLLDPVSSSGRAVSVSSHMGGLLTGMAIGALISLRLLAREAALPPIDVTAVSGTSPDRSPADR